MLWQEMYQSWASTPKHRSFHGTGTWRWECQLESLNHGLPCDQHSPDLSPPMSVWEGVYTSWSRRRGREDGRRGVNKNQSEPHLDMLFSLYSRNRFLYCLWVDGLEDLSPHKAKCFRWSRWSPQALHKPTSRRLLVCSLRSGRELVNSGRRWLLLLNRGIIRYLYFSLDSLFGPLETRPIVPLDRRVPQIHR